MAIPESDREVAQLEEVFKQAPAFFAVLRGPDHVFERVNEAYYRLTGRRDVIGKPLLEAIPEIRGQGFIELLDGVLATGEPYIARAIRAQIVKTAGHAPEDIFVDLIYAPLRSRDGTVVGIIAHGSDVTEQVRAREEAEAAVEALAGSEEQFRALANLIPTLAWMADPTGWIFWYNNRWYEYTGTTPQQMEGWGWQSVHDPEVLPSVMERWKSSISTGEPFEMEFPLRSAAGEFRWFLTRVAPVKDASGKVTRWFGTNTDVQAQHEAAEAARAANKAKSDFLAAMSHETRQPINATLSFIQLLEMEMYGALSDEQKDVIDRIRRNQEQLLAVITDILSFARLEAGRFELSVVPVRASDVLADLSPLVEPQVTGKGISLSISCSHTDAVAMGDRERILQILTNLVTNASRATPKGGKIMVRCVKRDDCVEFEVEDSGIGIPPEKIEEIFSPFVQLDRALNRPREGVGLGLAISRDFAQAMGGTLTAVSTPGEGSTFTLRLAIGVESSAADRG